MVHDMSRFFAPIKRLADASDDEACSSPCVAVSLLALRTTRRAHQAPASWRLHGDDAPIFRPDSSTRLTDRSVATRTVTGLIHRPSRRPSSTFALCGRRFAYRAQSRNAACRIGQADDQRRRSSLFSRRVRRASSRHNSAPRMEIRANFVALSFVPVSVLPSCDRQKG